MDKSETTNSRFVKGFGKADKKKVKKAKQQQDVLDSFFKDIDSAQGNPRFQIIVAHGVIEVFVNALIDIHCKHGDTLQESRDYPHSVKLLLLHELERITDDQYDMLTKFRRLRNAASHGGHFELTKKMVAPFDSMNSPARKFKLDDPANITVLCHHVVIIVWNDHIEELFNYFLTPEPNEDTNDGFNEDNDSAFASAFNNPFD